jgi:hypothetical protein
MGKVAEALQSDETVRGATGRGWEEWFGLLDDVLGQDDLADQRAAK